MLSRPGHYGDILRVIGRLLDERETLLRADAIDPAGSYDSGNDGKEPIVGYQDVEIVEHEAFVRVSWRTHSGSAARQAYTDLNLFELRTMSRQLRGEPTVDPAGEHEELLRTLGQELDAEELQVSGVVEKGEEFFVSGSTAGRYFNRAYGRDDLLTLSQHRQRLRTTSVSEEAQADEQRGLEGGQRAGWLLWGANTWR